MVDLWPPPASRRIDLAEQQPFDLGEMRVLPSERAVRMQGERRELQPRVMQVLIALARARPEVVSREKLIDQCWEGRIVGDDAINRCILALRHLALEFSPHPFVIETVPRIGHRLIDSSSEQRSELPGAGKWDIKSLAAVVSLLLAAFVGGLFLWKQSSAEPASIAVLPFENLSATDSYFAAGVGEEILDQLAREPAFRVAGRGSAAQFTARSDPREVGRKLRVDYILEGSVRSDQGRVRINASLVQARDGMRLWSETYDRKLEDILEIQTAIGKSIANELSRRLIHSAGARSINGEAFAAYLNARGLLRSAMPQSGQEAVELLEHAIQLEPGFAAAWASYADALLIAGRAKGADGMIAALPRAYDAGQRALQLDPNLPEAHAVLAKVLGNESPAAIAHGRKAAELGPRNSDAQMSGAVAAEVSGEYEAALAGQRRAHALDPLAPLPIRALIGVATTMGDRSGAERIAREGFPNDPETQRFALARVAWFSGDLSEAARLWSIVARQPAGRWASGSRLSLEDTLYALRLTPKPPSRPPLPSWGSGRFGPAARIWMREAPPPGEWQRRNRSLAAALVYYDDNIVAAKLMLNAGRFRELVATYDGPAGLLGIRKGRPLGPCFLDEAAIVAAALRRAGRATEADAILRDADKVIQALYRRGRVPTWVDSDAAAIWSLQGKIGPAVEALDRALRRGSAHTGRLDLPRLVDEPAFSEIRDDPRLKGVAGRYDAYLLKERQETARALRLIA